MLDMCCVQDVRYGAVLGVRRHGLRRGDRGLCWSLFRLVNTAGRGYHSFCLRTKVLVNCNVVDKQLAVVSTYLVVNVGPAYRVLEHHPYFIYNYVGRLLSQI